MLIFLTICTRSIVLVYAGLLDSMLAFTRPHRNQLHQTPQGHINGEKNKSLFCWEGSQAICTKSHPLQFVGW